MNDNQHDMINDLEIKQAKELNDEEKKQLFFLWNYEYPEKISYRDFTEFENYLQNLTNLNHYLLTNKNDLILGWAFTFNRDNEKWFGIILSEKIGRKGFGRKILDELKNTEQVLNGWVVDQNNELKKNGIPYISPLKFYEKCGFEIIHEVRLELNTVSVVKIKWTNKNSKATQKN